MLRDTNVYNRLIENFDFIIEELERPFLTKHKCNKGSELYLNFHDILIIRVESFMKRYTLPEDCDWLFDPVRGFITQFYKLIYYKGCVYDAYTKTNNQIDHYLNVFSEDQFESYVNIEEDFIKYESLKEVLNGFKKFSSFLSSLEKIILQGIIEGISTQEIIRNIEKSGYTPQSTYIITKKRKEIEFRLTCFFSQERQQQYPEEQILKGLNKFPFLNKRVFGESKLYVIPNQDTLLKAISGESLKNRSNRSNLSLEEKREIVVQFDPEIKIHPHGTKYFARSKFDLNGKKHDHYVVYINHSMSGFCQVTKQTKSLLRPVS